jgi:hypothetical protein
MGDDINVTMKLEGWDELRKKLRAMRGPFLQEMKGAIEEGGTMLQGMANASAPVQAGTLVSSSATATQAKGDFFSMAVGYTDPKAPAVHEGIHWRKREGSKEPGFHWFLQAFQRFSSGYMERVAQRLRKLVGGS